MKGKTIFIRNLIEATKDGNIKWTIDKEHQKSEVRCVTNIDTTRVIVVISFGENGYMEKSTFDKVHLFDKKNFKGGSSVFLRPDKYKEVNILYELLYKMIAKDFYDSNNNEEMNDNFLKRLSDKIGKSYFRGRRLDHLLKKKEKK